MAWDKFVDSLKKRYKELKFGQQWPPVKGDKLINLQLVETDKTEGFGTKTRCSISCDELFSPKENRERKVIVEGHAGFGKTTLCTMLAKRWANGEILTQFDCVLLLPLRESSVSTATIDSLPQLIKLFHLNEKIRTSVIEKVEEEAGEGILIIADGWDELSISDQCAEDSFLYKLFFDYKLLPFVSILLTSRPSASAPLHGLPIVDRLVEVMGFNEENVEQYIESEFAKCPEKASSLMEQLKNNPVIQSVCTVPINCAIVCHLKHTLDKQLPKTLTEFYINIVLNLILHSLRDKRRNSKSPKSLKSLDSIPVNDQKIFWLCCEFAYKCLSQDQIVFSEDEIKSCFPEISESIVSDEFLCLGLLQRTLSLLPIGHGLSFHFAHLTIQEFLAALYFVTLPNEKKHELCKEIAENGRFDMMWRFVFGLGCKKDQKDCCSKKVNRLDDEFVNQFLCTVCGSDIMKSHEFKKQILNTVSGLDIEFVNQFLSTVSESDLAIKSRILCSMESSIDLRVSKKILCQRISDIGGLDIKNLKLMLCHCSVESSADSVLSKVSKKINGSFEGSFFNSIAHSSYDRVAVFRVLQKTSQCTDMSINLSSCGMTDELLKEKLTEILSSTGRALQVSKLSLQDNKLTDTSVTDLLSRASASFTYLKWIDLSSNRITNISPLFSYCNSLCKINLSDNPLGVTGLQSLETAVAEGKLHNLEWLFLSNTFTDDADINGALLATLLTAIASHCPWLMILDLSRNNLSVPGASALDRLVFAENSMLDLSSTKINANAVTKLTAAIKSCETTSKIVIILKDSPLGFSSLKEIFKMLKSETCPIIDLDLSNTDLTTPESQCRNIRHLLNSASTSSQVHQNSSLTFLYLNGNNFSADRIFVLAEFVYQCKSLKWLYCGRCFLTSKEIRVFLSHLRQNSGNLKHENLKMWYLRNNSIDDEGVSALIESVPELFPNILKISLSCNPAVSPEAVKRLKEIVEPNMEKVSPSERQILQMWIDDELEKTRFNLPDENLPDSTSSGNHQDKNINQLDEPVRPHPAATDESTPPTVQSPHRMDQQETMSSDGTADVTTPPQTTPSPHGTLSGVSGLETVEQRTHTEEVECPQMKWSRLATDSDSIELDSQYDATREDIPKLNTILSVVNVTTPPQTTPSPHRTLSGVCGLETVTIEELKDRTKVTDSQLDIEIEEADMILLAPHFNNVETLCVQLRLTPAHQQDIKDTKLLYDTQTAVDKALRLWRKANPGAATYRALVETVLRMGVNGTAIAEEVCKFSLLKSFEAFPTKKTKTDIPFVKPVRVLEVSCRGDKYCDDSLGLCIDVPEGAVPKGSVLQLEIGVCLYGPFKFPGDLHPIAPILMVRPHDYNFQLNKSLRITLPHIIEDANHSDVDNLGIQVIKADHTSLIHGTVCKFDTILEDGMVHFSSSGDEELIEFSLSHFCFVTVRAEESKKAAERIGYCVCPLLPPRTTVESGTTFTYYLCVTYFMAPFIEAIKDQFFLKKSYELDKSKIIRFKFIGENNFIQAKVQNTQQCWKVSLYSANYEGIQKIHADLVDLWKKEEDVLKLEIENLMYPPSFQVIAIGQKTTSPSFVTVDFSLSEQPSFSISLPLPLESSHFSLNNSQDSTQSQPMTITSLLCSGKVNKDQLSREVKESDLPLLAEMFNDPSSFLNHFGLTRASKGDVKALISQIGNQAAMQKILELWWQMNPPQATFEKLLNIVLSEKRGDIALDICTHLKQSE